MRAPAMPGVFSAELGENTMMKINKSSIMHLKKRLILFVITAICASCMAGCTVKMAPDPKLVEAFKRVDQAMSAANAEATPDAASAAAAALEDLLNEMVRVNGKYTNVRMKSDLQDLLHRTGELFARVSNVGYNPEPDSFSGFYAEWQALRPRFKPFAGDAAENAPGT